LTPASLSGHALDMTVIMRYIVAFIASYAAGVVGALFVRPADLAWYHALEKPPFAPPDAVFGIVWIIIYALMALALGSYWSKSKLWTIWVGMFLASLLFNAAWTMFFFGFHAIFLGLFDITFLAIVIIGLEMGAWDVGSPARFFLIPYLIWILFAWYLNAGVWLLR